MLHRKLLAAGATILLRLVVFLDLQNTPSGYKISCQEDHIMWLESVRKNLPGVNNVYEIYVRRATGLFIVNTMQVTCLVSFQHGSEVAFAFPVLDNWLCERIQYVVQLTAHYIPGVCVQILGKACRYTALHILPNLPYVSTFSQLPGLPWTL